MNQKQAHETDPNLARLKNYIEKLGMLSLRHSKKTYWDHLEAIYQDLRSWGCDQALCNAGLFHDSQAKLKFQAFELPLDQRSELQSLIGKRAEEIAFLNCFRTVRCLTPMCSAGGFPIESGTVSNNPTSSCRPRSSTIFVACTCAIGWNASLVVATGNIGEKPTGSSPCI